MYDVIVIGGGIIGCMLSRVLSQYQLKVALVEKNSDFAQEVSAANSAIVHCGHDPEEGTLKAKLNVEGANIYEAFCKQLKVDYKQCGAYVVAKGETDKQQLKVLYERAKQRGIEASLISGEEARTVEQQLSETVVEVLSLPQTAIVNPWEIAIACAEEAMLNGVVMYLDFEVSNIKKTGTTYEVRSKQGCLKTHKVINAAGLHALEMYAFINPHHSYELVLRRGEYFVLDSNMKGLVQRVLYPLPNEKGKGVLVVPTVHGNLLLGPTAESVACPENNQTTKDGLASIRSQLEGMVKPFPSTSSICQFAGVRPTLKGKDFVIEEASDASGFYNVLGIDSPGIAAAPAIVEYLIELLSQTLKLHKKPNFIYREAVITMRNLSVKERNQQIKKNHLYGHMICRCNEVSEQEIIDCIHRPCGATTIKGIKKRVFSGLGRCQGGFCEPLLVTILARELQQDIEEVVYDKHQYPMLHQRGANYENI